MPISFPSSLDNFPDPSGSDTLGGSTPSHSGHHKNLNDAVEALEAKVGVNGSAVASSLDKKVADLIATAAIVELGYAENTTDFSTASATPVDITGLVTTVTVGTRPIVIRFETITYNPTVAANHIFTLYEDAVDVGRILHTQPVANHFLSVSRRLRRAPAAGSHTYKVGLQTNVGTGHAYGLSPYIPTTLQVLQV